MNVFTFNHRLRHSLSPTKNQLEQLCLWRTVVRNMLWDHLMNPCDAKCTWACYNVTGMYLFVLSFFQFSRYVDEFWPIHIIYILNTLISLQIILRFYVIIGIICMYQSHFQFWGILNSEITFILPDSVCEKNTIPYAQPCTQACVLWGESFIICISQ